MTSYKEKWEHRLKFHKNKIWIGRKEKSDIKGDNLEFSHSTHLREFIIYVNFYNFIYLRSYTL